MMKVSVRELKDHLSKYLHLVNEGEDLVVTSHHKPLAKLTGIKITQDSSLEHLLNIEGVKWNGRKPKGDKNAPKITGKSVSDSILEDRR